ATRVRTGSDGTGGPRCQAEDGYGGAVAELHYGPARVPSQDSPEAAIDLLQERGFTACEIDFEGKFWMDYAWAERFGELARGAGVEQLGGRGGRLERKDRAVPFGVEIMGRVRELGTAEDVFAISSRCGWVRPVLDFAHLHAVTDGGFTETSAFAAILAGADRVLEPGAPFHIHFSDIAFANRNETKHLPYGEGTLRAAPLGEALTKFDRPATVITESPDLESHKAIREDLFAAFRTAGV